MKKYYTFLFLIGSLALNAQQYFSLLIPEIEGNEQRMYPWGIAVDSENNIICHTQIIHDMVLTKYSDNGNLLYQELIENVLFSPSVFKSIGGHYFTLGNEGDYEDFRNKTTIYYFNSDLSLNSKNIIEYQDFEVIAKDALWYEDFIILSNDNEVSEDGILHINLHKIDLDGNILATKDLNTELKVSQNFKMIKSGDDFLMSSWIHQDLSIKSQVLKLDQDLNIIWEYVDERGEGFGLIPHLITELSNGNMILSKPVDKSDDWDYAVNNWYPEPTQFTWLDSDGNALQDTVYLGPGGNAQYIRDVTKGKGDYFFSCGSWIHPETGAEMGWIVKYDNEGNKIWDRKYRHGHYDSDERSHLIQQIIELDDGSIIALGNILIPGESGGWLLKLDSEGCYENESCGDNVVLATEDKVVANTLLSYSYPNPSKTNQPITFDIEEEQVESILVYNMNGDLIEHQEKVSNKGIVLNLNRGVYVLKVSTKDKTYRIKHIVIN